MYEARERARERERERESDIRAGHNYTESAISLYVTFAGDRRNDFVVIFLIPKNSSACVGVCLDSWRNKEKKGIKKSF